MRVAFVGPYAVSRFASLIDLKDEHMSGHPATWIENLSRALIRYTDVELHILTYSHLVSQDEYVFTGQIHYHILTPPRMRYRLFSFFSIDRYRFRKKLQEIQPDVVHGHGTESSFAYAAVGAGFPCIVSIQGILAEMRRTLPFELSKDYFVDLMLERLEKRTICQCDSFVAKTPFVKPFAKKINPQATLFDIVNPVDPTYVNSTERVFESDQTILFVGAAVCRLKGVEELIRAFAKILKKFPDIRLKIIGFVEAHYLSDVVEPLLRSLNLELVVTLCGRKPASEVAAELEKAMCLVVPSYMETSPNVISEAMTVGVPVVATRVGGIPHMVEDGVTGLLCKPKDVDDLGEKIQVLIENPEQRVQMGKRGREVAIKRHDHKAIAKKLVEAYDRVLAHAQ